MPQTLQIFGFANSLEKKLRVLKMYLENTGIRSIERLEGVPNPLIIRWIRSSAKFISELLKPASPPEELEDVEILEMDELYSFLKLRYDTEFLHSLPNNPNRGTS
jgi:hypothetical protein